MPKIKCPYCGGDVKKFGKKSAERQRWRFLSCGATFVNGIDNAAKLLEMFLSWLLGGNPAWGKHEHDDCDGGAGNDCDQLDMIQLTLSPIE